MLVTEFSELNKKTLPFKVRNNFFLAILATMVSYWLLINTVLVITVIINVQYWLLFSGFNVGFLGSVIGFGFLCLASKWLTSGKSFWQTLAYFGFILRMIVYGTIIVLIIFFHFANLITTIVGMSILMVATITAQLCVYQKKNKKKEFTCSC